MALAYIENSLLDLAVEPHVVVEPQTHLPFSSISPFTITLVGSLNQGELNLKEIFNQLPITETNFKAKEGKKVKINVIAHSGAILAAKYKMDGVLVVRGINKNTKPFNNCISLVMTVSSKAGVPEKNIDFKLFKDKIQTTGSRRIEHTTEAWSYLKRYLAEMTNASLVPIAELDIVNLRYQMIDISFDLGFKINRENLKSAMDKVAGFHIVFESGVHSNGVSVKFPLDPVEGQLGGKKKRILNCVSLIVFSTGKVIESGNSPEVMERVYDLFHKTMYAIRDKVELRILKR